MNEGLHTAYCRTYDGELLDEPAGPLARELKALAGRVPGLLGRNAVAMNALLGQGDLAPSAAEFEQVLLIDDDWYYIAQALAEHADITLLAIASRTRSLVSVLASVREHEGAYPS